MLPIIVIGSIKCSSTMKKIRKEKKREREREKREREREGEGESERERERERDCSPSLKVRRIIKIITFVSMRITSKLVLLPLNLETYK